MAGEAAVRGHRPQPQAGDAGAHPLQQVAGDAGGDQHPVHGVAGLPRVDVPLHRRDLGGDVEVGVRQHHQRPVAAELERQRLQARRRPRGDLLRHPPRPRERHLRDAGVGGEGLPDEGPVAGEARHQAGRQAGALGQVAQRPRRQRRLDRRLHHHRAAGGEGRGELPHDQGDGEVPGGDRRDHPDAGRAAPTSRWRGSGRAAAPPTSAPPRRRSGGSPPRRGRPPPAPRGGACRSRGAPAPPAPAARRRRGRRTPPGRGPGRRAAAPPTPAGRRRRRGRPGQRRRRSRRRPRPGGRRRRGPGPPSTPRCRSAPRR